MTKPKIGPHLRPGRKPAVIEDGWIRPQNKPPIRIKHCERCGATIPYKKRWNVYVRSRFCSKHCCGSFHGGDRHRNWKGGHFVSGEGYRKISIYNYPPEVHDILWPMVRSRRFDLLEHRAVMAIKVGRPLSSKETVHHLNGDKADNRPENLELRVGSHGVGATASCLMCPHCGKSYGDPTN